MYLFSLPLQVFLRAFEEVLVQFLVATFPLRTGDIAYFNFHRLDFYKSNE